MLKIDFQEYSKTFLHFYTGDVPPLLGKYLKNITRRNSTIVDLGCGDGALLIALLDNNYFGTSQRVIGIDLSQERIGRLQRCSDFELYCADVNHVPNLNNESVDFIICTQVIEHVPNDRILAEEMYRQLNNGGRAYVASLVKKWYGWFYYKTKNGKWALDPTHEREYSSLEEFETVLNKAGFKIVESRITQLKLSIVEFLVRRVLTKFIAIDEINTLFVRHPFLNVLRKILMLPILGYFIIEVIVEK